MKTKEVLTENIRIRLTEEERELLHRAAESDDRTMYNWGRHVLLNAARAQLKGESA